MGNEAAWKLLDPDRRPASPGRYLLRELLEIYCRHQWDLDPDEIVRIAIGNAAEDASERDMLRSTIVFIGNLILDERIATFARRIGGGPCDPLPLSRWEIDDVEPRFASSALSLDRWWDPAALPSHWIFVDSGDVDRFMDRWLGKVAGADIGDAETPALPLVPPSEQRLIRMPAVKALTGLSRSTVYAKMAAGTFPPSVVLGTRMAAWYEDAVREWVKAPR